MDGVYFNRGHVDWLRAQKSLSTVWYSEEESRVPYTPYYPTHYLYVGEKAAEKVHPRASCGSRPTIGVDASMSMSMDGRRTILFAT